MSSIAVESPLAVPDSVVLWRFEELERAGYPTLDAAMLSERHDIDLHLAVRLTREGCPVETALRILL